MVRRHPQSLKLRQALPPFALAANVLSVLAAVFDPRALAVPIAYTAVLLTVSAATGRRLPPRAAASLPLCFLVMHISCQVARPRRALPGMKQVVP